MHEENVNTGTPQQTQQLNSNVVRFKNFGKSSIEISQLLSEAY